MKQEFGAMSQQYARWGNRMMQFCGYLLIGSSVVKFLGPGGPVAYMASMGFEGGTLYVVAILELLVGVLFLLRNTRMLGLLLVSSYFGGAIASHLAIHRLLDRGGPFVQFMAAHRYIGALIPATFLVLAWTGMWWAHPSSVAQQDPRVDNPREHSVQSSQKGVIGLSA